MGYFEFIRLLSRSKLVLTDSGGVQEEACVLRIPCVTLRDNTERPETLMVGSNTLAGTQPGNMREKIRKMLQKNRTWHNPFGDGRASTRIVKILTRLQPNQVIQIEVP